MKPLAQAVAGLAGATAVTLINETVRQYVSDAPRMDVLGERGVRRIARGLDMPEPGARATRGIAFAGDIALNTAYYALVGTGRKAWMRGAILGAIAGLGAVILPPYMGLGRDASQRTNRTKLMTFAYYFTGGLIAAAVAQLFRREERHAE
jgi:hypothetical protein